MLSKINLQSFDGSLNGGSIGDAEMIHAAPENPDGFIVEPVPANILGAEDAPIVEALALVAGVANPLPDFFSVANGLIAYPLPDFSRVANGLIAEAPVPVASAGSINEVLAPGHEVPVSYPRYFFTPTSPFVLVPVKNNRMGGYNISLDGEIDTYRSETHKHTDEVDVILTFEHKFKEPKGNWRIYMCHVASGSTQMNTAFDGDTLKVELMHVKKGFNGNHMIYAPDLKIELSLASTEGHVYRDGVVVNGHFSARVIPRRLIGPF